MNIDSLRTLLEQHHQTHVIDNWSELNERQQTRLASQLSEIDFGQLQRLIAGEDDKPDFAAMASRAQSPPSVRADGSGCDWSIEEATARGEDALRAGEVGAVIVAGGQGTRLGFEHPKGMFPIGPVSNRTLFQFFADMLIAIHQKYGCRVPLYLMTSEATDEETQAYFKSKDYLGLDPHDVHIFKQGTMPAVEMQSGRILLESNDSLALSPDGHGGTVGALQRNGCFADANQRGVKYLAYIQVDNPLAQLCDPTLIGHHLMAQSEMTTQVVRKRYPEEKVGNVVLVDGMVQIIEYSDLPDEAAKETDDQGDLKLWAGNIAVHVFDIGFLERISKSADALPYHRAFKKVPHLDAHSNSVHPESPNATKFERFIFDLLPQAKNAFVVESLPSESFAPVKNAEGAATDTATLAKQSVSDLHRYWLSAADVQVAEGVLVEINPRFSLSPSDLSEKLEPGRQVSSDTYFVD